MFFCPLLNNRNTIFFLSIKFFSATMPISRTFLTPIIVVCFTHSIKLFQKFNSIHFPSSYIQTISHLLSTQSCKIALKSRNIAQSLRPAYP